MKLSKNNIQSKLQKEAHQIPHFSIRKLTIGAASVLLSTSLYLNWNNLNALAAENSSTKHGTYDVNKKQENPPAANESLKTTNKMVDKKLVNQKVNQTDAELKAHIATAENLNSDKITPKTNQQLDLAIATAKTAIQSYSEDAKKDTAHRLKTVVLQAKKEAAEKTKKESVKSVSVDNLKALSDQLFDKTMHLDQTKADKGELQKIIDFGIELDSFLKNKNLKAEQLNNYETNAKRMLALVDKLPKIQINAHGKSMPQSRSYADRDGEDRDFDLKNLSLHKPLSAKEFNSDQFKLQQEKNSAIAFLQYALSWNNNPQNTVVDETAGGNKVKDEEIKENAILGINVANNREQIRQWLDYVFWHKRGMFIVPQSPDGNTTGNDVFALYKPGTFLYGTHNNAKEIPTVKEIHNTVYVKNSLIKDQTGKLVGYHWTVEFNQQHADRKSGHYYFTTPKGQSIVSSNDSKNGIKFADAAIVSTDASGHSKTLTGRGYTVDNIWQNATQNDFLPADRVSGTAQGPEKYYGQQNWKTYTKNGVNQWWGCGNFAKWSYIGSAHTLKDIIYKHYWQGSNYSQSGCTKLNKDEWGDEAQFTNSRDGIKMGPFIDNLYKYKYDFVNGKSSDYQRIDYAQLIQENTDRVYMFEAKQDDPNTYKITFDTRIDDPKSTNVHNPYYAAGYHSYENRTTVNYMQWGGLRFKPELSITVNGKKNNILVDPQTHNDYVEVHEGEKTKISLNSKNDKQGLAMWSTEYKSTSALSWQLGKADENLFNADYKETPVDVDNNAANPYVHQNARMELSGVVIAKPGSEMNIAWAGSGMPNFTADDITSVYGDKTQMDDGLNAFLPNREIRAVNVRVIPAAAYAQKTKIAIRFKGQQIVLSEQEKQAIKKTIYDANKDHYDIKNGENGITVDNSGNVSFTIQFNAAKHKDDRANMQYRTLKLKPADTLSYTTIDIKPVDGSASFSLNSKNGAIDPTLTVYNHEPYQVKVNATDTTSKMNDFLTSGGTNVPNLTTDHNDYQKNHRGMHVDDKTPYVLTMNGQGLSKDGKTYKIKFESWDGNDTKTVSQEVKVVVADQAGRYQNKVKGRTWTVEVNDKIADHLKPENFVDDSTKAMLGKAPSGVAGKTGVTYTFKNGVPAHDHVTKGNTPKDVTVVAKFTDNSTLEIKGKLIVNDTQAPIVEFDTTDHKVANEGNNNYQLNVYSNEKFDVAIKAHDNSNIVQDLRAKQGNTLPQWISSDEEQVQTKYKADTKGKRDSKGTSNNPYIIHLTGTVPNNMVNQTYKVSATAWDDVDHTGTANLEIHILPQCDKYKNLLQGKTQTIEVKEAIPDIKSFVTAKGVQLPDSVKYAYEGTGFDNTNIKEQNAVIKLTFADKSYLDVHAKLNVQDTHLATVQFASTDAHVKVSDNKYIQSTKPSDTKQSKVTITAYVNEEFGVNVNANDNSGHIQDVLLSKDNGSLAWMTSNDRDYQQHNRYKAVSESHPYQIQLTGTPTTKGTSTAVIKTWDGANHEGDIKFTINVLDQAAQFDGDKLNGATKTVEVNDNVVLSPTDFVDAKTQALLKKAANDVKYTWTTSDGKQPANNTVSTKTNGKYQPSDVKIIAKFSDGSTKTITGHLIVQDTKAPTVKFEETPNVTGNKITIGTETSNNQKSVTITTYRNEKFSFDVKANDNSKLVSDVKLTGTTLEGTSTDHDSKKDHGTDPYTLTIFGSFTPTTQTGQYTRAIQATDKAGNSSNTSFKFYVKEQAAQFDGQTLTGQTQTVTLHTKINQNEVERYVSDATKSLLKKANGNVTYSFKDMKELSTDAVSADGKQVHVIATFSDKSTKEIIGTLIVNDKNAPTVNFVKGTNSGPVQIDNQSKTITVYRNENFNINANVKDDSKVVNDAKLTSKDTATHNEFTITTDHDSNHNHGHDPYVLNISGGFGTQAKLGSYSRTIHAVDGNNNSGDTNFKFVVKDQAAQFDGDQLHGATKTVEVNSGYTPKAEDFIDKNTLTKIKAANGNVALSFKQGTPKIETVKTETVPITVTFSDKSTRVINGTLKVQDTTVPSLKLIKTNSNKKNRVGEITCTPSDSKHKNSTATVVVYRNEQFSIQALATDNSNIINDARFHGSAADITDNHDVYQAQYRGKKGKVNDPYVVTIEGGFSKDLKFDPNTHTKTIDGSYVRAWDGVDNTNDLKIKFIVKDQSAQFDNDKLNGTTKVVEINSANIPQAQDFIDPATLKKLNAAKDGITCTFVGDKAPKIDTVKINEPVNVVVTFSDKSTKTIQGHLTVKDTTAPVITVSKAEKGKCVVNGDQITVYNNEPFNLNVSAVDNSNHVSNITIEGTHEGVSLTSDHKGEGSKAKPYTAVISGTFNDKGTHTITLDATDASHNKGTKKLTVVVKGQDAQFDNQTLTGITKTVEVNDDSVSLKPEDFVSQDTKNLLGKATKGVKWTFVDNKELDKSKVTSANTGKEVHIKAEFADKTSKTIVGHLIVQDTKAPTLELVSSDPKSKDIVVTKGSDNSYNITVYRGREFKLLAKATDNSHVVTDVNIAGGDINGFSNDHDTYIKNLAKNPKGTSKDPYVLTMKGTFANDFSTGLYTRTVTAKDASGHSTTITMKITLKSQNERFKDEFHGYKVLVPEQLDWPQIFKAENQPVPPKDFVAIPADAPDNLSYRFECDDSGNPCIYVDFADKSSLKLSLETITADAQNKNRVAETIQRNIIIKKDGQSTTSVQKAEFIRYIILKSEGISKISSIALDKDLRSASISDEYGQWLTKSKSNDNEVTYSDNAELSKYDAKKIVGYQKVETANDTLEVKPNSNDSINKYLIEKTDENDFSPAKKIPDIVIEYKRLADVISVGPNVEKPAGYVTVTFSAGEHGKLSGTTSYYVNPEATQVELTAPTVQANTGYKFKTWDKALKGQFKSDTKITAQYEQLANVITNDGQHEKPAGYVTVTFDAGEHGKLSGQTSYYVNPEATQVELTAPTVQANTGYKFKTWDKALKGQFKSDTKITAQYEQLANVITNDGQHEKPAGYVTVTFDAGEHGKLSGQTSYYVNPEATQVELTAPTVQANTGYKFKTWDKALKGQFKSDTKITAQYEQLANVITNDGQHEKPAGYVTVTFDAGEHGKLSGQTSYYVNPEATQVELTAPTVQANTGYKFKTWDKALKGQFKSDTKITAQYEQLANVITNDGQHEKPAGYVTVTFDAGEHGKLSGQTSYYVNPEATQVELTAPTVQANTGYKFKTWDKALKGQFKSDTKITAQYEQLANVITNDGQHEKPAGYVTVTFDAGEHGKLSGQTSYYVNPEATQVELTAPTVQANTGYKFKTWDKALKGQFKSDTKITAQYEQLANVITNDGQHEKPAGYVTVTFDAGEHGKLSGQTSYYVNPEATQVELTAPTVQANTGYKFKTWDKALKGQFKSDTKITAQYEQLANVITNDGQHEKPAGYVTVTFDAGEHGKLSGQTSYYVNPEATQVELTAPTVQANTGYKFKTWDKALKGQFKSDTKITAQYEQLANVITNDGQHEKPAGYVTVTFDAGEHGKLSGQTSYYVNPEATQVELTAPTVQANTGYKFKTWDKALKGQFKSDTKITAQYEQLANVITNDGQHEKPAGYVTVTFDAGEHGKLSGQTSYYVNPEATQVELTAPTVQANTGYKFKTWDKALKGQFKSDTKITAQYEQLANVITNDGQHEKPAGYVTVTFDAGEHGKLSGQTSYYVNPEATQVELTAPTVQANTGYKFKTWDKALKGQFKSDTKITAQYEQLANVITNDGQHEKPAGYVTVTFDAGEHGKLSGQTSYYVNPEATQVELTAPTVQANTGYKFKTWDKALKGQFKSDTKITAQYEQLANVITNDGQHEKPAGYVTVTFDAGEHGKLSGQTSYYVNPEATQVELTAPTVQANTGYKFKTWDKALKGQFKSDTKITAQYEQLANVITNDGQHEKPAGYVTVTFDAGEHGKLSGQTSYYVNPEATQVELTAPTVQANTGYKFKTWDKALKGQFKSDTKITAQYEQLANVITNDGQHEKPAGYVTVTFDAGEHGKLSGQTSYYVNPEATQVELTAPTVQANTGYKFKTWDKALKGQFKSDTKITAQYEQLANVITNDGQHEKPAGYVTVTFDAGEHGKLSGQTSYYVNPEATQVELTAPTVQANTGYKFKTWDKALKGQFKSDTKITAQYNKYDDVIPVGPNVQKPIDNISNNDTIGNDLMNNTSDLNNEANKLLTANKPKDLSTTEKKTNSKITKRLPQTGEKENSVLGLLIIGLSGLLGIVDRKKRKDK
ncbi:sialoglycan-binding domain-containing protein [Lactobacillus iners]|uniref:sialoglycan-binding domain-containing protein n=1 Tax=Lactobacillus iners TaxID=147802 RepID=UPI003EBD1AC5